MNENPKPESAEQASPKDMRPADAKESIYARIPLTKKQLDVIIVVLMAATIVTFVLGALVGNGVISL